MMATQWEYKVICTDFSRSDVAEKVLNAAGSDGWEAVAAWGEGCFCHVILKRQKSK
jgi:hypothetical protein